ncbi:SMI1/KNR4 family protein [Terrimonas sp. NA20]|uniref:SMI1/KNR4 family protein n=1 Tax=Terrimonas ginsenosidimutans TaxID=2908004 RepID=A0ABS9KWR4_9BACT|nr:SMI1/KNR4 family protein [Terrimonas ginsenosidimutans]MCG2616756.1 SMI1/KNR4 family protein [Terrimonas ginsenosidimutans]
MNEQVNRIKGKLKQLKQLDNINSLFGAQKHRYKINPPISSNTIQQFEATHQVKLPDDYITFLTEIGNGGAGPYYGLEPLQNSIYADLDYPTQDFLLNPGKPFVHTEPWNLTFEPSVDEDEYEEEYENEQAAFEEKYFNIEHMNGVVAICNFGCAISLNLVVNGAEYGNIWTDDRASDQGIYPSYELGNKEKITFLNWYELWLDNSLKEIRTKLSLPEKAGETALKQIAKPKPWWKIW